MEEKQTVTVPAKSLIDKPSLDEEMKMAIGMALDEMIELKERIIKLEKKMEELKNGKDK